MKKAQARVAALIIPLNHVPASLAAYTDLWISSFRRLWCMHAVSQIFLSG